MFHTWCKSVRVRQVWFIWCIYFQVLFVKITVSTFSVKLCYMCFNLQLCDKLQNEFYFIDSLEYLFLNRPKLSNE